MSTGASQAVAGHLSKQAATIALFREGKKAKEIAELIGSTADAVYVAIAIGRKNGELPPSGRVERRKARDAARPEATPGMWTPEKAAKVRRLYGTTLIYIAEAVDVDPAELLRYVIHGVIPPSQTLRDATDIAWNGTPLPAEQRALPAPVAAEPAEPPAEPSREDDEAELARLAAPEPDAVEPEVVEPAAPVADTPPCFRLMNGAGAWLARDLGKFTYRLADAWQGNASDIERVIKLNRNYEALEPMRVK